LCGGGQVHFLEDVGLVTVQNRSTPTTSVHVPFASFGIASNPDGTKVATGTFFDVNGETKFFHLAGKVSTPGFAGSITIVADQEDDFILFAISVHIFAISQRIASGFHFRINDFFGFLKVVCVFGFKAASGISQESIISKVGHNSKPFGQGTTSVELLVDVVAVNQIVECFANLAIAEDVETFVKFSRVELKGVIGTV